MGMTTRGVSTGEQGLSRLHLARPQEAEAGWPWPPLAPVALFVHPAHYSATVRLNHRLLEP